MRIPIERQGSSDIKNYRISLSNLIGGNTSEDLDKVRLNSIKTIIGIFRRLKSKVDIELIGIRGGDRYDYIPNSAYVDFCVKEEYESDLLNIFNLYQSEFIEKNLKYEPNMEVALEELDDNQKLPIAESFFDRLSSFVELVPTGAYTVNSTTKELISSINLSTLRTFDDFFSLIVVYRSLSDENMREMLEKTHTAAKISSSEISSRLQIPRWKNKDDSLTSAFKESYHKITGEDLRVIKTQYSLDSSVVFKNLNVKIISLGVEYKQGEDNLFYTKLSEISLLTSALDELLSQINSN